MQAHVLYCVRCACVCTCARWHVRALVRTRTKASVLAWVSLTSTYRQSDANSRTADTIPTFVHPQHTQGLVCGLRPGAHRCHEIHWVFLQGVGGAISRQKRKVCRCEVGLHDGEGKKGMPKRTSQM